MAREVGIPFYRNMIEHCKVRISFYNKIRQQWQERLVFYFTLNIASQSWSSTILVGKAREEHSRNHCH